MVTQERDTELGFTGTYQRKCVLQNCIRFAKSKCRWRREEFIYLEMAKGGETYLTAFRTEKVGAVWKGVVKTDRERERARGREWEGGRGR